jgi:hypothetical protein
MDKTYTATKKDSYKGPPLRSVSIGDLDYEFKPGLKEYTGVPAGIARHLKAHNSDEFQIAQTKRSKK